MVLYGCTFHCEMGDLYTSLLEVWVLGNNLVRFNWWKHDHVCADWMDGRNMTQIHFIMTNLLVHLNVNLELACLCLR